MEGRRGVTSNLLGVPEWDRCIEGVGWTSKTRVHATASTALSDKVTKLTFIFFGGVAQPPGPKKQAPRARAGQEAWRDSGALLTESRQAGAKRALGRSN